MKKKIGAIALAIVALFVSLNFLLPSSSANAVELSFNRYSHGIATIGTGDPTSTSSTSSGIFNVDTYNGNPAATMRAAFGIASRVHFLRGTYVFSEPFKSGQSGISITADPGTTFTCTGSNAVAFLGLTGSDVTVSGISFVLSEWVDDQVAVSVGPAQSSTCNRFKLVDCKFAISPSVQFFTDHDDATPMIFAKFDTVVAKWVERCMFFPQSGVTCVKTNDGNGLKFVNSEISNWTDGGFPELTLFADMYRGIDITGDEWLTIAYSKFWAIGNYTLGIEPDACIRIDNSALTANEYGHVEIIGNIIENVNTPRPIYGIGVQWGNIVGNLIGPNFAAVNADGEAALKFVGSNATATTVTTIVAGTKTFTFTGTNPALSTGETFYLATTGLANPSNARVFTASAASTGSGPWTVVSVESPAADETAITGVAYVATSGAYGPRRTEGLLIAANDIHNSAGSGSDGCALWLEHCVKVSTLANHINLQRGKKIVRVDTASCMDLVFNGNSFSFFENVAINPTSVFLFPDGVANRIGMSGNTWVGDPVWYSGTVTGDYFFPYGIQERTADGGGDTNLAPEAADTAEQLTTNINLNNG